MPTGPQTPPRPIAPSEPPELALTPRPTSPNVPEEDANSQHRVMVQGRDFAEIDVGGQQRTGRKRKRRRPNTERFSPPRFESQAT